MIKNPRNKIVREGRLSRLIESGMENADLLVAAQAIPAMVQDMVKKLVTSQNDIFDLETQIKDKFGAENAEAFSKPVQAKIQELVEEMKSGQDALDMLVTNLEQVLNGGSMPTDMDGAMGDDDMGDVPPPPDVGGGAPPPPPTPVANADGEAGLGDDMEMGNAAGRARKESMTIRGRQIESAVKKLRESKNPDAIVLAEFRLNLTKHSIGEAASRTAKTFRIDINDVVEIVKEAKENKDKKKKALKKVFGDKCPPFKGVEVKKSKDEKGKKVAEATTPKKKVVDEADPCWKGYKMVGTKKKDGKKVPNCVKEDAAGFDPKSEKYNPKAVSAAMKADTSFHVEKDPDQSHDVFGDCFMIVGDQSGLSHRSGFQNQQKATTIAQQMTAERRGGQAIKEAVPQGTNKPRSPAELRAARQQQQNGDSSDKNQVAANAPAAPGDMPGKIMTSAGAKPQMPTQPQQQTQAGSVNKNAAAQNMPQNGNPMQNTQAPQNGTQQPQQGMQAANGTLPQNGQQAPKGTTGPVNGQPMNDEDQPTNGQQNGQKQIVQSGNDGVDVQPKNNAKVEPATQKPGFNANTNKVTMMSTTRPMPKPEHSLMGSGMTTQSKKDDMAESVLLRKIMKMTENEENANWAEAAGLYFPEDRLMEFHDMSGDFTEDKPEPHARLLGYVIQDSHGHIHGCKWIPSDHGHGRDEGSPKYYADAKEARAKARQWTEEEGDQDSEFLDTLTYTVGAAYSDGSFKFPA